MGAGRQGRLENLPQPGPAAISFVPLPMGGIFFRCHIGATRKWWKFLTY